MTPPFKEPFGLQMSLFFLLVTQELVLSEPCLFNKLFLGIGLYMDIKMQVNNLMLYVVYTFYSKIAIITYNSAEFFLFSYGQVSA